jgi:hypothetical protein
MHSYSLNASYSVHFEVQFDRIELFTKKHKNNQKVRVRFDLANSYLIRFSSI